MHFTPADIAKATGSYQIWVTIDWMVQTNPKKKYHILNDAPSSESKLSNNWAQLFILLNLDVIY